MHAVPGREGRGSDGWAAAWGLCAGRGITVFRPVPTRERWVGGGLGGSTMQRPTLPPRTHAAGAGGVGTRRRLPASLPATSAAPRRLCPPAERSPPPPPRLGRWPPCDVATEWGEAVRAGARRDPTGQWRGVGGRGREEMVPGCRTPWHAPSNQRESRKPRLVQLRESLGCRTKSAHSDADTRPGGFERKTSRRPRQARWHSPNRPRPPSPPPPPVAGPEARKIFFSTLADAECAQRRASLPPKMDGCAEKEDPPPCGAAGRTGSGRPPRVPFPFCAHARHTRDAWAMTGEAGICMGGAMMFGPRSDSGAAWPSPPNLLPFTAPPSLAPPPPSTPHSAPPNQG